MKRDFENLASILKKDNKLFPCTQSEVNELEAYYAIKLPDTYKQFLLAMGKGAGQFMLGSDCFYDSLFKLKEWAKNLLAKNGLRALPEQVFVFWMHQGYQFSYFSLEDTANPPVFYYIEDSEGNPNNEIRKISEDIPAFFYKVFEDEELV